MNTKTDTVYKYVDRITGTPLYVGCSNNLPKRHEEHLKEDWWAKLHKEDLDLFFFVVDTRADGEAWESHIISQIGIKNLWNKSAKWGSCSFLEGKSPEWHKYNESQKNLLEPKQQSDATTRTCNRCIFSLPTDPESSPATTSFCKITKRKGSVLRGNTCDILKDRNQSDDFATRSEYDGLPIRSKMVSDYRTKKQWLQAGYCIKEGECGAEMHPTFLSKKTFIYYLPDQISPISL